ncbi:MAG: Hsp20/alpha crystallin family protein [Acidimicrobiales bacterium]
MVLMRFDPFREAERANEQAWAALRGRSSVMPLDAYRRGDEFVLEVDLPGVDPGSIDLTVEKNVLTVTAERNEQRAENDEVVISERPYGRFSRQLFLGEGLDLDKVHAAYEQGVLTVTLPVADQAKPRKVEIAVTGRTRPEVIDTQAAEATVGA